MEEANRYVIFDPVGGQTDLESNSLRGIIAAGVGEFDDSTIRTFDGLEWKITHKKIGDMWQAWTKIELDKPEVEPKQEEKPEPEPKPAPEPPPWEAQDGESEPDPFSDELTPEIEYVVERWSMIGDSVVVETKVTNLTVTWEMSRGEYNNVDQIRGYMKAEPSNLKLDIVVPHATAEIKSRNGDLGIIGQVFRSMAAELSRDVHKVLVDHLELCRSEVRPEPTARGGIKISGSGKGVREQPKPQKEKPGRLL